jgi:hypothetical protein
VRVPRSIRSTPFIFSVTRRLCIAAARFQPEPQNSYDFRPKAILRSRLFWGIVRLAWVRILKE